MSFSINSNPEMIDNDAKYDITTSLVEDSSHVNLRVRAEIFHRGDVVASVELPKGVSEFDFKEILESYLEPIRIPTGVPYKAFYETLDIATNLITSWAAQAGSSWDTLTTLGAAITSAIEASTDAAWLESNTFTVSKGDILVFASNTSDYVTTGTNRPIASMRGFSVISEGRGLAEGKMIFFQATEDSSAAYIRFGHPSGELNFSGWMTLHKLTNEGVYGNPFIRYFARFTEYFENASGVTTSGATYVAQNCAYVKSNAETFDDYIINGATKKFLQECITAGLKPIITSAYSSELHILFISDVDRGTIEWSFNNLPSWNAQVFWNVGWGVLVVNGANSSFNPLVGNTDIRFRLRNYANADISETLIIEKETKCYNDPVTVTWEGDLGHETMIFKGEPTRSGVSERTFYKDVKRINRQTIAYKRKRTTARTLNETETMNEMAYNLLSGRGVAIIAGDYIEATVITDAIDLYDQNDLLTNEITLEHE